VGRTGVATGAAGVTSWLRRRWNWQRLPALWIKVSTGPLTTSTQRKGTASRSSAFTVSAGILLSRLIGLVRDRVFAHYFGNSNAADAFRGAFRIPNFLQTLFGEGVLSASFIPVYARLRAEERHEEANQLAEAIFAILFLIASLVTLAGVFAAPWLIDAIVPGFKGETRLLTIRLVQILFPGAALLVMSAWCLGILNSHRKFFLSYSAPVIWNVAMITALLWKGGRVGESRLAIIISIASVIGSGLQFAVQLPTVMSFLRPLHLKLTFGAEPVQTVVRNFFPVFLSRGVVQVSAYVDSFLASFLPVGAVSALAYAQTLNSLPVSLFGMAISAAELPAMSSALGTQEEIGTVLRQRLENGLNNISFFVVPSAVAFVVLGDVIVATIYRGGHFTGHDVTFVWSVLAGSGGQALLFCVLCATGYTYAVKFRDHSGGFDGGVGVFLCFATSAAAGYRSAVGGSRAYAFRRTGRVGGVCFAAPRTAGAHWRGGGVYFPSRPAVGGGSDCFCVCLRGQACVAVPPAGVGWVVRAFDFRAWVSWVHPVAWCRCPR
jgi:murein biosynthesis integral membrane protein MurJ